VPESAWLTKLSINSLAGDLKYDLAVDATGDGTPSRVAAGLERPAADELPSLPLAVQLEDDQDGGPSPVAWAVASAGVVALLAVPAVWVRRANGRGA
jgi:hypothetical protein